MPAGWIIDSLSITTVYITTGNVLPAPCTPQFSRHINVHLLHLKCTIQYRCPLGRQTELLWLLWFLAKISGNVCSIFFFTDKCICDSVKLVL